VGGLRGIKRMEFPLLVQKKAFVRCCRDGVPHCEFRGIEINARIGIIYGHVISAGLGGEPMLDEPGGTLTAILPAEHEIPHLALSVRQPWAWALLYAGKDLENRDWRPTIPGPKQRGWIAIHASKGMTKAYYQEAAAYMRDRLGIICPGPQDLPRGGIVGSVVIVDLVTKSDSPWFFGPYAFVLRDARPCSFRPASGVLGFFKWERS
jgi:hypothetical protein